MPPLELTDVAFQMLRAHMVVHAVKAPLERSPEALQPVRMGLASDVLAHAVPDGLVVVRETPVGRVFVRVDGSACLSALNHELVKRGAIRPIYRSG